MVFLILLRYGLISFLSYLCIRSCQLFYRYRQAQRNTRTIEPDIILVLGGEKEREYAGVELVRRRWFDSNKKTNSNSVGQKSNGQSRPIFHYAESLNHPVFHHLPKFVIVSSGHFKSSHSVFDPIRLNQTNESSGSTQLSPTSPSSSPISYQSSCEHYTSPSLASASSSSPFPASLPSHLFIADHQAIDTVTNFSTLVQQLAANRPKQLCNAPGASPSSSSTTSTCALIHSIVHEDNENEHILAIPPLFLPCRHIYILTANYHMPRSLAIGHIIFSACYGIGITPVSISDPNSADEIRVPANSSASLLSCNPPSSLSTAARAESKWRTMRDAVRALIWAYFGIDGVMISRYVHPNRWKRAEREQHEDHAHIHD